MICLVGCCVNVSAFGSGADRTQKIGDISDEDLIGPNIFVLD